ncbi:hypothetical protein Scep_028710 [Stephania cephalantha]|uniref:CONSTANS-like protein n=1 Tax=Stephania cephalantha TaxID=152367 RepID=A0AAP0EEQ1_9MAGN
MTHLCDLCKASSTALIFCGSDDARLCRSCDARVHSANALSRRHVRAFLCELCFSKPAVIRCLEDEISLCEICELSNGFHCCEKKHRRPNVESFWGSGSAERCEPSINSSVCDLDCLEVNSIVGANPALMGCLGLDGFDVSGSGECYGMNETQLNLDHKSDQKMFDQMFNFEDVGRNIGFTTGYDLSSSKYGAVKDELLGLCDYPALQSSCASGSISAEQNVNCSSADEVILNPGELLGISDMYGKHIRYKSRKERADNRRRVKGRFVKTGEAYDYDPAVSGKC